MPSKNNSKGVKMSLGDFMGGAPANELDALPTAPKQRGPDDDGSFQRRSHRDDGPAREVSRADQDNSWRRGGGGGFADRDNRYNDDRGGSYREDRGGPDRRGGYRDDRGGFDRRGVGRDSGFERGAPAPVGERPRLQLKSRTAAKPDEPKKSPPKVNPFGAAAPIETKGRSVAGGGRPEIRSQRESKSPTEPSLSEERPLDDSGVEEPKIDSDKNRAEQPVFNSRAAMLSETPESKSDNQMRRDRGDRNSRGPPPVVNRRFADLADEERGKNRDREVRRSRDDRGPPLVVNSRFAAAAEADRSNYRERDDRGPPPVANSRFAAAAEADRSSYRERDDRGPPPVANSRFAAAAEADRSSYREREDRGPPPVANSRFAAAAEADRSSYREREDRGPPPVANSRFAAAAEADRSSYRERDDRGPPPIANSRFAAAAAMAEGERRERDRDGFDRDKSGFADDRRTGPVPQNSRFAAAVAADEDYVEPSQRGFGNERGRFDDRGHSDRYDRRGRDDYERRGRDGYDRYNEWGNEGDLMAPEPQKNSVADLLKPKARPMEDNILKVPTKEHADNFLKPPSKQHADEIVAPASRERSGIGSAPDLASVDKVAPIVEDGPVIAEFISGNKLGEELKAWVGQHIVPSVEKLVFTLLDETQKLNPDVTCAWAEPHQYGAALVSLVEDDLLKQVDLLFAIQKYCNKIGMPKLNDEYVIQAMFRSMYKYDLASDEAFEMWKEDESEEHGAGKVDAVIQTVDWFNWLDEEDEEDEYEE